MRRRRFSRVTGLGLGLGLGLVTACGDGAPRVGVTDAASPDASQQVAYRLTAGRAEPPDRPPATVVPTTYIDGEPTMEIDVMYPDAAALLSSSHVVELRHGSAVIATFQIEPPADLDCLQQVPDAPEVDESLCAYDSGDLRFGGDYATNGMRTCVGDGFCAPRCGCPTDQRCAVRVTSTSPMFSHLGCTPSGTKLEGEACTFTPDPAGAYDDCSGNLVCVNGTCHALCPQDGCTSGTCSYVPGYPPEIKICE